jgi:molybdenum cofactor cytidylyltransferase
MPSVEYTSAAAPDSVTHTPVTEKYCLEASVSSLDNPQVKPNLSCSASSSTLEAMGVPAIILAAGASRRLGQPKQLVRVLGEALLARTIRVVDKSASTPILVVLGAHRESILADIDLSNAHPVINPNWEQGIATSIHAGIDALQQLHPDATAVLLLVCDQPNLTAEHLRLLIETHTLACEPTIVASQYAGIAGIPAIFPLSQFAHLMALQGDTGARHLLRNPDCPMLRVSFEGGEVDIDTPFDLNL